MPLRTQYSCVACTYWLGLFRNFNLGGIFHSTTASTHLTAHCIGIFGQTVCCSYYTQALRADCFRFVFRFRFRLYKYGIHLGVFTVSIGGECEPLQPFRIAWQSTGRRRIVGMRKVLPSEQMNRPEKFPTVKRVIRTRYVLGGATSLYYSLEII